MFFDTQSFGPMTTYIPYQDLHEAPYLDGYILTVFWISVSSCFGDGRRVHPKTRKRENSKRRVAAGCTRKRENSKIRKVPKVSENPKARKSENLKSALKKRKAENAKIRKVPKISENPKTRKFENPKSTKNMRKTENAKI